jgi:hypothetical protein
LRRRIPGARRTFPLFLSFHLLFKDQLFFGFCRFWLFFCEISLKTNLHKNELNFHSNFAASTKKFEKTKEKKMV